MNSNYEIRPPDNATIEHGASGNIWLDDSGIVIIANRGGTTHTLEDAREGVILVAKAARFIRRPLLIDMSKVDHMPREVREYYTSEEACSKVTAVGILTRSALGKVLANFFLGFNKPKVPTRLFTDPQEAMFWLKSYVPQPVLANH